MDWFRRAAEQGPPAEFVLGLRYMNGGEGVPQIMLRRLSGTKSAALKGFRKRSRIWV